MRRDGITIRPAGLGAQVKRPREAVSRGFPAFGHPWSGVGAGGAFNDEPLKDRVNDFVLGDTGDDLRIQILHFGAIANMEGLHAVNRRRGFFTASGQEQRGEEGD